MIHDRELSKFRWFGLEMSLTIGSVHLVLIVVKHLVFNIVGFT